MNLSPAWICLGTFLMLHWVLVGSSMIHPGLAVSPEIIIDYMGLHSNRLLILQYTHIWTILVPCIPSNGVTLSVPNVYGALAHSAIIFLMIVSFMVRIEVGHGSISSSSFQWDNLFCFDQVALLLSDFSPGFFCFFFIQLINECFCVEKIPLEKQDPVFRSEDIHILKLMLNKSSEWMIILWSWFPFHLIIETCLFTFWSTMYNRYTWFA